jgi:hypothetical protein
VRGADINVLVGRVRRNVVGFQASGLYSHVEGDFRGAGVAGIANYVKSDAYGFQYSGLVNFIRGDFTGFHFANIFNYVEGSLVGGQATVVFNLNDGDVRYFQFAAVANAVAGEVVGVQASTGLNYVNESMLGGQLALANFARYMTGVQVGIGNVAGVAHGVQAGFLNLALELDGVPIGMINYVKDGGDADWITYASNIVAVSTGIRTIHRRFYSFLALGVGDLQDNRNDTAFLSWHYGYRIPIGSRWDIGFDAGYLHIMPTHSDDPNANDKNQFAIQGRAIAQVKFSDKLKVYGGVGVSQRYSAYSSSNTSTTDPVVMLGISAF